MKILLIILIVFNFIEPCAQPSKDTTYRVEITATASSIVSFFRNERYPGGPSSSTFGYGVFGRVMWHPGRLLSVGVMTGYAIIAEDEFTVNNESPGSSDQYAKAKLSAVPLQVVISMAGKGFEAAIGMGPYMMQGRIEYGTVARGDRLELGLTFMGSYHFTLSNNFSIGPELRVLYLSYRGIISVMPSLTLQLETLRY
jgi:hypothetical protein